MIGPIAKISSGQVASSSGGAAPGSGFGEVLTKALEQVNASQNEADTTALTVADGSASNLHDMTIALAKADVELQLTVAVRDRAVDAYRQIMQMQL